MTLHWLLSLNICLRCRVDHYLCPILGLIEQHALSPISHNPERTSVFLLVCLNFFRAAPAAYGGSQARGWIRATAAGHSHSHSHSKARSKPCLQLTPRQYQILKPLSRARDWTHVLMDTSRICFYCAMTGTPRTLFFQSWKNLLMAINTWMVNFRGKMVAGRPPKELQRCQLCSFSWFL